MAFFGVFFGSFFYNSLFYSPRNATASKDLKPRKYVEVAPKDFSWYDETIDRLNRIIETHGIRIALHSPGKSNDKTI